MGNDICSDVSFKSVCFDFLSTYIGVLVIENSQNPHFGRFRCHYPLMTYLSHHNTLGKAAFCFFQPELFKKYEAVSTLYWLVFNFSG